MILSPSAKVVEEVVLVTAAPSDSFSEATATAVWVTKFDVAHYCHKDVLLRLNHTNDPEIALCNISEANILSLVQFFRAFSFNHAIGSLSVTTTAEVSRFK